MRAQDVCILGQWRTAVEQINALETRLHSGVTRDLLGVAGGCQVVFGLGGVDEKGGHKIGLLHFGQNTIAVVPKSEPPIMATFPCKTRTHSWRVRVCDSAGQ